MSHNALESKGFAQRLFYAYTLWQGKHGRKLNQTELGRHVGRVVGYKIGQYTVSDWFRGESQPSLMEIEAIGRCLEIDPGWLAFGKASLAPGPHNPVMTQTIPVPEPSKRRKD